MDRKFLQEDFERILLALEEHDGLLSHLWYIGKPRFVDNLKHGTACLRFNEATNSTEFLYDTKFYEENDFYTNLFFTSHEIMHCVLDHLRRSRKLQNKEAANIAADLVVHNALIDSFSFDRSKVRNWERFCWCDSMGLPKGLSMEEYYELIEPNIEEYGGCQANDISGLGGDQIDKIMEQLGKVISEEIDDSTKSGFIDKILETLEKSKAGTETNETEFLLNCRKPKESVTWKKFLQAEIRKILHKKRIEGTENEMERWDGNNKRLQCLPKNLFLPNEQEREDFHVDIVFFLDTSMSCIDYKEQFFNTLLSVPTRVSNATIKIDAYSFDTKIYNVDMQLRKVYGGGGTAFHILEDHVLETYKQYPKLICVITDGVGTKIDPKLPQNWRWFLTEGGSTNYLPTGSKTFEYEKYRSSN